MKKKLPKNPQYKKQVKTYTERHGRQGYSAAGRQGGLKSPTSWDSKRGREAAIKRWEAWRKRKAENENREQPRQEDQSTEEI